MYDIITITPEDAAVMQAVNAIAKGSAPLPAAKGYRFITPFAPMPFQQGDGGIDKSILAVVEHGSPNSLAGLKTWTRYCAEFGDRIDWSSYRTIYLVACSTADEGQKFGFGNIATEVFAKCTSANAVWASERAVRARDLAGDWVVYKRAE